MSITVAEFFVFQLPMFGIALTTIFQKNVTGVFTLHSEWVCITFVCWFIDSIINPLWTTLLAKSK